jgi:nitrogen regulatory protein PII 1
MLKFKGNIIMQLIRAIVRPEKTEAIVDELEKQGQIALTKIDVIGRGKQRGIQVDNVIYDELPKKMLMIAVEDDKVNNIIDIISESAFTGNFGDGKIFVSPIEKVYTVRTRSEGL